MKAIFILTPLLAALSLSACTKEQMYSSAQSWQRSQCNRLPDKAEFDRCMGNTNTSFDSYRRETEPGRQ